VAKRTLLSWSSGKDSAYGLYLLRQTPGIRVEGLFTTVNRTHGRVAMHAVSEALLDLQARAIDLPLRKLEIPYPCSNECYNTVMGAFVHEARSQGIEYMAFGDVFLEDIRTYREEKLKSTGIAPLFPLWGLETDHMARALLDESLLKDLPAHVDPCGENGEFHTFVYDGPIFSKSLKVRTGEIVERDGFVFADIIINKDVKLA
jgi:diphthamide synthase (EF-2-diphthine--ammonia ligase)